MKKQTKIVLVCILCFVLIIILGFASSQSRRSLEETSSTDGHETSASVSVEEYKKEQDTIMAEMMRDMMDIPESGSASVDFLNGMIPHHQSAVAMSESYLEHGGRDEELKKLAQDIITQQEEEIEQMKSLAETLRQEEVPDEESSGDYLEEFEKMMDHDHAGHSTAQNIDWAFAEGMIMHHQMAIDMSELILKHTQNEDVKTLAENIIELQNKEIEEMNKILERMAGIS